MFLHRDYLIWPVSDTPETREDRPVSRREQIYLKKLIFQTDHRSRKEWALVKYRHDLLVDTHRGQDPVFKSCNVGCLTA